MIPATRSRMEPPPTAVAAARTSTPTTSNFLRTATRAPVTAKVAVPM
jgi:hypothetical protein